MFIDDRIYYVSLEREFLCRKIYFISYTHNYKNKFYLQKVPRSRIFFSFQFTFRRGNLIL